MERKELFQIRDELEDVTALVAFLQQITTLEGSMNEQSKSGLFLFIDDILNRLNKIQSLVVPRN